MYTPNITSTEQLKSITLIISGFTKVQALYWFGSRSESHLQAGIQEVTTIDFTATHYYLLLFTENTTTKLQSTITNAIAKQIPNCSVTLLIHKPTALNQHAGNQVRFFSRVMQSGTLLQEDKNNPIIVAREPSIKTLAMQLYWKRRKDIAEALLDAQSGITKPGVGQLEAVFLRNAAEHICLGLIRVFLGYRPNYFSLEYLFELCEYFSPLTSEIFQRDTHQGQRLFAILNTNPARLKSGHEDTVNDIDIETLALRCNIFLAKATQAAEEKLLEIESNLKSIIS